MKYKLFGLIFLSLLFLTAVVVVVQGIYFQNERMQQLEDQIRHSADHILESDLVHLESYDESRVEAIMTDQIGVDRVGQFLIVWDRSGRKLFESSNVRNLHLDIPRSERIETLIKGNYLIRAMTLDIPEFKNRQLQVGIVVDKSFIDWTFLSRSLLIYTGIILVVSLLSSAFLLVVLLQPIREIAEELQRQTGTSMFKAEFDLKKISEISKQYPEGHNDEFGDLVGSIKSLMSRINSNLKFQKVWAFQMAHEIKTPLFLVREAIQQAENSRNPLSLERAKVQLEKCHQVISDFLGWAEVATLQSKPTLFASKLSEVNLRLVRNFELSFPGRLQLESNRNLTVLCNPNHLEQLLSNILMNALVHTEGPVSVKITERKELIVTDQGHGIDPRVLEKIGSPFNKGSAIHPRQGSGLGLAWIKTLCDVYGWDLSVESGRNGTVIKVQFPEV